MDIECKKNPISIHRNRNGNGNGKLWWHIPLVSLLCQSMAIDWVSWLDNLILNSISREVDSLNRYFQFSIPENTFSLHCTECEPIKYSPHPSGYIIGNFTHK